MKVACVELPVGCRVGTLVDSGDFSAVVSACVASRRPYDSQRLLVSETCMSCFLRLALLFRIDSIQLLHTTL